MPSNLKGYGDIECNGNETKLEECTVRKNIRWTCSRSRVAAVSCFRGKICMFDDVTNNNTHKATIALLPSTTHPQSWAEPHIHVFTGKSLPCVPPSPEEHYRLPLNSSHRQILSQGLYRARVITIQFCLRAFQIPTTYSFTKLSK